MSDVTDLNDGFCPVCGDPVITAQAVAVGDPLNESFLGSYETETTHISVEAGEIRLYKHKDERGER